MKYGREYARRPSGGGGWLLVLALGLALLIGYGGSESIVELREEIAEICNSLDNADALETLGRSFK